MSQIFICYSRQNQDIVKTLAKDIKELGHTVWFDEELTGGQNWWDQILERIRKCDIFLFAIAQEALDSPACKLELKYAFDLRKTILPVRVAVGVPINLVPPILSAIHHVDYQRQDKQAYKSLDKSINTLPYPNLIPDPLPRPPEAPIPCLGKLKDQIETRTLSFEEQTALLLKLEESLRESEDIDDVRNLLERMRKREDLFVMVAEKIDALLISKKEASPERITTHIYEKDTRTNNSLIWRKRLKWPLLILVSIIIVIIVHTINQTIMLKRQVQQMVEISTNVTDMKVENIKRSWWTIQIITYNISKQHIKKATNLAKAIKDMTGYNTFVAKREDELVVCVGKFNSRDSGEIKKALEEIRELEYEGEKDFTSSYLIQIR